MERFVWKHRLYSAAGVCNRGRREGRYVPNDESNVWYHENNVCFAAAVIFPIT